MYSLLTNSTQLFYYHFAGLAMRRCILHTGSGDKVEPLSSIKPCHWQKIQKCSQARKRQLQFSTSKYSAVISNLPEVLTANDCFHMTCYKNFTAVTATTKKEAEKKSTTTLHLRSCSSFQKVTSNTGVLPRVCTLCGKKQRRRDGKLEDVGACETDTAEMSIKEAAVALKDDAMLAKFGNINFCTKEVKYHHSCRSAYLKSADRVRQRDRPDSSDWKKSTTVAFQNLCMYISSSVIENKTAETLSIGVFQIL